MGQTGSAYDQSELSEFQDLTYFTKREVLHVHKRFKELSPEKVKNNRDVKLKCEEILTLPELAVNPFKHRILEVFSEDGTGDMTFEQFLDMMSQMSSKAPLDSKVEYAFKIYDFNGDGQLCGKDIEQVILFLTNPSHTGSTMSTTDREQVVQNVIGEMDMDDDGTISFMDFKHGMSKQAAFQESFKITL